MAVSQATSGFGCLLKRGDGASPEVFSTIAEVTGFSGPGEKLDMIECTHMESPNSYKEYIPSLLDAGEISFDINFLPAHTTQTGLRSDMTGRTKRNFQIIWSDTGTTTYSFAGYITSFQPSAKINDKLSASVTIKVTSSITVA